MLLLNNLEGERYNPFIDQYLVLRVNDYVNTDFTQIEQLFNMIEASHNELIMIETDAYGLDLIQFLDNISKIVIFKVNRSVATYHITVQKNLIDLF
jgi:hypothetical protein